MADVTVKPRSRKITVRKYKRPEVYSPRLRIVIDPVYIQTANLTSSSTYHKYSTLVQELVRRGHFVYWCIPEAKYVPNEIENHPNVGIIRTSYIQDQFVVDGLITEDYINLFNRVNGKYHADVMCTSRNSLVYLYKRVLDPPRNHDEGGDHEFTDKSYSMPVVLIEEFPQTPERQASADSYWMAQCLGYAAAERTIFLSPHNQSEVAKAAYDVLAVKRVADALERFRIIPAGIECEQLDAIYTPKRWEVESGFNVLTVGRIIGESYSDYLEWANYLYKSGMDDFSITMSLSGALSGPMRKKFNKIGFDLKNNTGRQFHLFENNPRKNFLKMLQRFHCFICPLSHLDHPTGLFETIYLGVPGIMPKADYQQSFFQDWPWVIDKSDKAGLLRHLKDIRADPVGARAEVLKWRSLIRENYDAPANIETLADEIEDVARHNTNRFRTSSGVINLCRDLNGRTYSWADTLAYLRKAGIMGVSIGDMSMRTTFTYGRSSINHAMKCAGFVDTCEGPLETFERRDSFDARTK